LQSNRGRGDVVGVVWQLALAARTAQRTVDWTDPHKAPCLTDERSTASHRRKYS